MNWDRQFIRPVMNSAGEHPAVFLEILARRAESHPDAIELFSDAMQDMAEWYTAQACGLRAVRDLRKIADNSK